MDAPALEGRLVSMASVAAPTTAGAFSLDQASVGGDRANGLVDRVGQTSAALEEAADQDEIERGRLQTELSDDTGGQAAELATRPPISSLATGSPRSASAKTISAAAAVSA